MGCAAVPAAPPKPPGSPHAPLARDSTPVMPPPVATNRGPLPWLPHSCSAAAAHAASREAAAGAGAGEGAAGSCTCNWQGTWHLSLQGRVQWSAGNILCLTHSWEYSTQESPHPGVDTSNNPEWSVERYVLPPPDLREEMPPSTAMHFSLFLLSIFLLLSSIFFYRILPYSSSFHLIPPHSTLIFLIHLIPPHFTLSLHIPPHSTFQLLIPHYTSSFLIIPPYSTSFHSVEHIRIHNQMDHHVMRYLHP